MFIYVLCIAMRALYRTLAKVYIELNLNLVKLSLDDYIGARYGNPDMQNLGTLKIKLWFTSF